MCFCIRQRKNWTLADDTFSFPPNFSRLHGKCHHNTTFFFLFRQSEVILASCSSWVSNGTLCHHHVHWRLFFPRFTSLKHGECHAYMHADTRNHIFLEFISSVEISYPHRHLLRKVTKFWKLYHHGSYEDTPNIENIDYLTFRSYIKVQTSRDRKMFLMYHPVQEAMYRYAEKFAFMTYRQWYWCVYVTLLALGGCSPCHFSSMITLKRRNVTLTFSNYVRR